MGKNYAAPLGLNLAPFLKTLLLAKRGIFSKNAPGKQERPKMLEDSPAAKKGKVQKAPGKAREANNVFTSCT